WGRLLNRSTFEHSISVIIEGLRKAIPPEPPSLACPIPKDWRAMVAERGGVHSLGEPERADVRQHWQGSLAHSRGRARARPRRYGRAYWRARSPADCDARDALRPARSTATKLASPRRVGARVRRGRPAQRGCAGTCCHASRSCQALCDRRLTPAW